MKRVTFGSKQSFAHCKLYRDEIEDIIELLTVEGKRPTIRSDRYEIEEGDDLFEYLGKDGRATLEIKSQGPYSIEFDTKEFNGEVSVSTYGDSTETLALLERVASLVRHNASNRWLSETPAFAALSVWMLGTGVFLSFAKASEYRPFAIALAIVGLIGVAFRHATRPSVRTRFFGVRRHEKKSFWERKKDDLIEKAVMILLSAAVGWAVGHYLTPQQVASAATPTAQQSQAKQ